MKEYIFQIDSVLINEETGECCIHPKVAGELIRCKDCKHWNVDPSYDGCSYWSADPYEWPMTEKNDYCSYGERKDK